MGMSATLPNVDGLARWLNRAQLYETNYRPVKLSVFVKKGARFAVKAADTTRGRHYNTTIAAADDVGGGSSGGGRREDEWRRGFIRPRGGGGDDDGVLFHADV